MSIIRDLIHLVYFLLLYIRHDGILPISLMPYFHCIFWPICKSWKQNYQISSNRQELVQILIALIHLQVIHIRQVFLWFRGLTPFFLTFWSMRFLGQKISRLLPWFLDQIVHSSWFYWLTYLKHLVQWDHIILLKTYYY